MSNIKKPVLLSALLACSALAFAHDFTVTTNGQRLFFKITSKANKTAAVTYEGSIANKRQNDISGDVEIPSRVKHDDVIYTVTAIEAKTFANATKLKGITLPPDLAQVGDFAFEGCTSLERIVFGNKSPEMGQGVFFKCTAVRHVSLGSDWKTVNLGMFRWSDSLTAISIPAKMEKIQNLKMLRHLRTVTVDANNTHFTTFGGVLYAKDGKTLYGCPRGFEGRLTVHEGTQKILSDALIDCPGITDVDFPASLTTLSFRCLSRNKNLQSVVFRATKPISTAYAGCKGVFLLQVASSGVRIRVPNGSKKAYKAALVTTPGEYKELNDDRAVAYQVAQAELPDTKDIVGVKDFSTLK